MQTNINPDITYLKGRAWLSLPFFENHLLYELNILHGAESAGIKKQVKGTAFYGDIVYKEHFEKPVFWHRVCMEKPFIISFSSVNEAADILRSLQRNWALYPFNYFRRAALIEEKLPFINKKPKKFPFEVPVSDMGLWTLLDRNTIFASAKTSSPFPRGELFFEEDKINPPSRAYLKIQEALSVLQFYLKKAREKNADCNFSLPAKNSLCIDAGASPGGWSWVLDSLGCKIKAIDRSPLSPELMVRENIEFIKHDAFTLKPEDLGKADWVCSDVICYPPRLYEWVLKWIESGLCDNFICTIKMQGTPDNETAKKFARIPNSVVIHLTANKHELTWLKAPFIP